MRTRGLADTVALLAIPRRLAVRHSGVSVCLACTVFTLANAGVAAEPAASTSPVAASAFVSWAPGAPAPPCMSLESLRDAVSHVLGRPLKARAADAEVLGDVRFERAPDAGWNVHIRRLSRTGGVEGERTLHGPDSDCAALQGPTSLVLAMILDRPAPAAVWHAPPAKNREPSPMAGRTSAGATAAYGFLPGLAGGLVASADLLPRNTIPFRWSLAIWPGADEQVGQAGGRFRAWTAGLAVCPSVWTGSAGRLEACGGLALGSLSATGLGLSPSREPSHFLGQWELKSHAALHVAGPVALRVGVGALVPWNRPHFVYSAREGGVREVHRPWFVSPVADAAIEFAFGP